MNFPEGFISHLKNCDGFDEAKFIEAHNKPAPISVRINSKKIITQFNENKKVPWCDNAFYLNERPQFVFDPLFHAGCYYVHEASGMFIEYILKNVCDLNKPLKVLDLCAAPGGKSTLIASVISGESILVSNEVIKSRVNVLKENLIKWGNKNVVLANNDAKDFSALKNEFDVIVIDAPCSGSGLFRKDKNAMDEWSEENVLLCSRRQQRIVEDIIPALKENGILIYATCSYSKEENEKIIDDCLLTIVDLKLPDEWGIIKNKYGFRFYPDKVEGEGFFVSVLKKNNADEIYQSVSSPTETKPNSFEKINEHEKNIISHWLDDINNFEFIKIKSSIIAIPKDIFSHIETFISNLNVIKCGINCGQIKHNDFIPSHELAMSDLLKKEIPRIELSKEDAIKYLRKENFNNQSSIINHQSFSGWALITFQDINLGWIKILKDRINNYYPVEWRIRMK